MRSLIIHTCLLFLFSCQSTAWAMGRPPVEEIARHIRVAVILNAEQFELTVRGPYRVVTLHTDELLAESGLLRKANVCPTPSGIKIGQSHFKIYALRIQPERKAAIYVNRRRFRGDLDIIKSQDQKLLAVNRIDVEDYLRGVLCHEVSHRWPMEVLKVQAIAARTFALYQKSVNFDRDYDLTSDIYSQVYGGRSSERYRTNRAVDQTSGKVLVYHGSLFPSYYHATCGAHTEDASRLWDIDILPLKGVSCDFCQGSPHLHWRRRISLANIEAKLKENGYEVEGIRSIVPADIDDSHRILQLKILHSKGTVLIPGKEFRQMIGPDIIRSTNFSILTNSTYAKFEGVGWGHGVGLCQWGAYFMAREGYKAKEILEYYYPGAEIKDISSIED